MPPPSTGAPPPEASNNGNAAPNAFDALAGPSPFCKDLAVQLSGAPARNCGLTETISQPHPTSSYGLDAWHSDDPTDIADTVGSGFQSLVQAVWLAAIYGVKGVLLLLEWAFSVNLVNDATMPRIANALNVMHNNLLGESWMLLGIAVAALWGIWNGLVRLRTVDTLLGLAATVGLMIVALVIIANPEPTVGHFSKIANESAMQVMRVASLGTVKPSASGPAEESYADALAGTADTLMLFPWCALQFGDVDYCIGQHEDGHTVADVWLAFPAGGPARKALYQKTAGQDQNGVAQALQQGFADAFFPQQAQQMQAEQAAVGPAINAADKIIQPSPAHVAIQQSGGMVARLALLAIILFGLLGAILLLFWLGFKLVYATILTLLYTLLAPAMLIAPSFGASGRASTVAWLQRLAGAIFSKFVFALLLAILLLASGLISRLGIGFLATWLVNTAFWWGAFLKRSHLVSLLSLEKEAWAVPGLGLGESQRRGGGRMGLLTAALAVRAGRDVTDMATAPARGAIDAVRGAGAAQRIARSDMVREAAQRTLDGRGRDAVALGRHSEAQATRGDFRRGERYRRALMQTDNQIAAARRGAPVAGAPAVAVLQARRSQIMSRLSDPGIRRAEQIRADLNRPISDADVQRSIADRSAAIERGAAPDEDQSLIWAGIDPRDYRRAVAAHNVAAVEDMRDRAEAAMAYDADYLERTAGYRPGHDLPPLPRDVLDAGWQEVAFGDHDAANREAARRSRDLRQRQRDQRRAVR
jgi:hypothetical protein